MRIMMGFLLLILAASTLAMDSTGRYAVWGVGRKACFSYNKDKKAGDGEKYRHYEMGYLTAYNAITSNTYNVSGNMSLEAVGTWIDDYCAKHPMNSFDQALTDFVHDHAKARDRQAPAIYSQ